MERIILIYNFSSILNENIIHNLENKLKCKILYSTVYDVMKMLGRANIDLINEIEGFGESAVSLVDSIEIKEVPIDKSLYRINKYPIEHIEYNIGNIIIKKIKEIEVTKENAYDEYNELKKIITKYEL
tara:strand:- start:541 stop:924 length:384 start_codon:yes stop_codon:yes gene_type:complete